MKKWICTVLALCFIISSINTAVCSEKGTSGSSDSMPGAALTGTQTSLEKGTAKVSGIVLDADTRKPVPGAKILADGVCQVSAGKNGKFLIKNIPNGVYHWRVWADGYRRADYWRYSVHEADQEDIFTFLISRTKKISKDQYPVHAGVQEILWEDSYNGFSKTLEQALQCGQADGVRLESVHIGNFMNNNDTELLAVFAFDSENAFGLECKAAAVFDKTTKKTLSYIAVAGNIIDVYVMSVQNGADYLLLSWTSKRQGHASHQIAVYQAQAETVRMKAVPMNCLNILRNRCIIFVKEIQSKGAAK